MIEGTQPECMQLAVDADVSAVNKAAVHSMLPGANIAVTVFDKHAEFR